MVLPLLGHAWMPCTTEQIPQHLLSATSVATTMNPLNMYALTCRLVTSTCNPVSSTYRHVAIYMTTKTMIYHTYEYAYFLSWNISTTTCLLVRLPLLGRRGVLGARQLLMKKQEGLAPQGASNYSQPC